MWVQGNATPDGNLVRALQQRLCRSDRSKGKHTANFKLLLKLRECCMWKSVLKFLGFLLFYLPSWRWVWEGGSETHHMLGSTHYSVQMLEVLLKGEKYLNPKNITFLCLQVLQINVVFGLCTAVSWVQTCLQPYSWSNLLHAGHLFCSDVKTSFS